VLTMLSLSEAHCEMNTDYKTSRRTVARDTYNNQLWTLRRVVVEWRRRRDRSSHYRSVFRHWSRQSSELTQRRWQYTSTACRWPSFHRQKHSSCKSNDACLLQMVCYTTDHNRSRKPRE